MPREKKTKREDVLRLPQANHGHTPARLGRYTVSTPGRTVHPPATSTAARHPAGRTTRDKIVNQAEPSKVDGKSLAKAVRQEMQLVPGWTKIKEKAVEEEFNKIKSGTIIREIYSEKTTNPHARPDDSRYFPTPDGFYLFKSAPWIVFSVNKETWTFDCRRMTRQDKPSDANLTAAQHEQYLRVLYPEGISNSNAHGHPVVKVGWCRDPKAGNEISVINLDESRTIHATKDMDIYGALEPASAIIFIRACSELISKRALAAEAEHIDMDSINPVAAEPAIADHHPLGTRDVASVDPACGKAVAGMPEYMKDALIASKAQENFINRTTVESCMSLVGDQISSSLPAGSVLGATEAPIHEKQMIRASHRPSALEDVGMSCDIEKTSSLALELYAPSSIVSGLSNPVEELTWDDEPLTEEEIAAICSLKPKTIGQTIIANLKALAFDARLRCYSDVVDADLARSSAEKYREKLKAMEPDARTPMHVREYKELWKRFLLLDSGIRGLQDVQDVNMLHQFVVSRILKNPPEGCNWNQVAPAAGMI
ncbi:hypothetical protein J4E83_009759 [Alternaria metachromatica]|uniref:uncharacterized protein n=1 Tax=Alternaria metachromatica TaxID=283354 RepID=UPI0020C4BA00|nr:uncharacterized protein J4E83_009759 [Alternaria metachromatica]KAI4607004.1 hypothetical protein J4E83_009759 [Alternaria metachromatica]